MDAIKLLEADHEEVEMLFEQYEAARDDNTKAMTAEQICKCLTVHATIEEELFYPHAREVLDQSDQFMLDDAEQEHAEAKEMITKIMTLSTGDELDHCVAQLKVAIEHHVSDEEDELFPKLEDMGMETMNLGIQMETRKKQLKSTVK